MRNSNVCSSSRRELEEQRRVQQLATRGGDEELRERREREARALNERNKQILLERERQRIQVRGVLRPPYTLI